MLDKNRDDLKIYAGSLAGAVSMLKWFIKHDPDNGESVKMALKDISRMTDKIKGLI